MSKHYTRRRQVNLECDNQITDPNQLQEGLHIGVVSIIEPISLPARAAQALAAAAFSYGRKEGESRLTAAKQGWQFRGSSGLLPAWHGIMHSASEQGVWVDIIGRPDDDSAFDYLNQDLETLPTISRPVLQHTSFESMGLLAVAASDGAFGDTAGRWMLSATLLLG